MGPESGSMRRGGGAEGNREPLQTRAGQNVLGVQKFERKPVVHNAEAAHKARDSMPFAQAARCNA